MIDLADGDDKSSPLANCIRNNYRHIRKWAKRTQTDCFRIYDREIKQYPLAIDFYAGRFCIHYFSTSRETDEPRPDLVEECLKALTIVFGKDVGDIYERTRVRRKRTEQYEKAGAAKEFITVVEYGVKFLVNLQDYLDTGLFLDHRETRQLVAKAARGKRLLNLFAYTCSFSVQAAAAGTSFTKSVDMSNTYTEWGKDNFALNALSLETNRVVRADCLKFLDDELHAGIKYDVIVIDPPTISRSKKMDQLFDIQVDYIELIRKASQLLLAAGVIFFSTNSRKFVFDFALFPSLRILDISKKTLPIDFHDPKIHRCWKIRFL